MGICLRSSYSLLAVETDLRKITVTGRALIAKPAAFGQKCDRSVISLLLG